jgi:hypothetical protein
MARIALMISGQPRFCQDTSDLIAYIKHHFAQDQLYWFFALWDEQNDDHSYNGHKWGRLSSVAPVWRSLTPELAHRRLSAVFPGTVTSSIISESDESCVVPLGLVPRFYKQLWALYKVNQMRTGYENQQGWQFDLVIRLRPDSVIRGQLNVPVLENTLLIPPPLVPGSFPDILPLPKEPCEFKEINDVFAMGSGAAMTYYSNLVLYLDQYLKNDVTPIPECLLHYHLHNSKEYTFADHNIKVMVRFYREPNSEQVIFSKWATEEFFNKINS